MKLSSLNLDRPIHFSGIGGSAMNGLALLVKARGFLVIGTDPSVGTEVRHRLQTAGIPVFCEQDGSHISPDTQLVVATAALPDDHPELNRAKEMGIPVMKYAAMLGAVMSSSTGIAVAGTHGKTTTSAMTVAALDAAGVFPEYIIGGLTRGLSNCTTRNSEVFVAEACEFDRSFLNLFARTAIITNIEEDHLDVYRDLDDILLAFSAFAANLKPNGTLVYCRDSVTACQIAKGAHCQLLSYGFAEDADIRAVNAQFSNGQTHFEIHCRDALPVSACIRQPGHHNVCNALGAFGAGLSIGADSRRMLEGLSSFSGVGRRFESHGEHRGIEIVDDYAHHPTEIRMLLSAAKTKYPQRRLVILFQPHQISRTAMLFDDFCTAFSNADLVVLTDIYAARDHHTTARVTSADLSAGIVTAGTAALYMPRFEDLAERLISDVLRDGDVLLTAGAGNVNEIAHRLCALLLN